MASDASTQAQLALVILRDDIFFLNSTDDIFSRSWTCCICEVLSGFMMRYLRSCVVERRWIQRTCDVGSNSWWDGTDQGWVCRQTVVDLVVVVVAWYDSESYDSVL